MENYILKDGREITVSEMMCIVEHYEIQCTMEYLRENYEIPEEKLKLIASEVRRYMNKYGYTEIEATEKILNK